MFGKNPKKSIERGGRKLQNWLDTVMYAIIGAILVSTS